MLGSRFKAGLEVDSGAEFHDWTSDGSFGGRSWYFGLRHRSGAQGTSGNRSSGLAMRLNQNILLLGKKVVLVPYTSLHVPR